MRRYFETLFRYKEVFLIPLVLVPALALLVTMYTGREYKIEATVWVDPSNLLQSLELSNTRITPSTVEATALTERLSTESFRKTVVDRSGLTDAIEAGQWPVPSKLGMQLANVPVVRSIAGLMGVVMPVGPDQAMAMAVEMVGESLVVEGDGNNLLRVTYTGKEPVLGQRFVEEALLYYNETATALRRSDSEFGIGFYSQLVEQRKQQMDMAAEAERQYLQTFPAPVPGQNRPATELAELQRLANAHELERTLYTAALQQLEQVRISGEAILLSRAESFSLVDAPQVPETASVPGSALVMNLIVGLTLGGILGLAPIIALTWSDNTVRTRSDVEHAVSVPLLAQVPLISAAGKKRHVWIRTAVSHILTPDETAGRGFTGASVPR